MSKPSIILTRYLYIYEEVCLALLIDTLKCSNINNSFYNVCFWISELYYSGYNDNLIPLFLDIYYGFYYTSKPEMETYIIKQCNKYKKYPLYNKEQIKIIISMFRNLAVHKNIKYNQDNALYLFRNMVHTEKNHTYKKYKGRKSSLISSFNIKKSNQNKEIITLLEALEKNDKENMYLILSTYLFKNKYSQYDLFNILLDFYLHINPNFEKNTKKDIFEFLDTDKSSIIISLIYEIHNFLHSKDLIKNKNHKYVISNNTYITFFTDTNKYSIEETEDIIYEKRMFKIPNEITMFDISRDYFKDKHIKNIFLQRWLYYTKNCPIWMYRMKKYRAEYNDEKQNVIFKNEYMEELFNKYYNYQVEEQPKEITNSMIFVKTINIKNVLFNLILKNIINDITKLDNWQLSSSLYTYNT